MKEMPKGEKGVQAGVGQTEEEAEEEAEAVQGVWRMMKGS